MYKGLFNHSLYYESRMFLNVTKVILKPYRWFISLLRVTAAYKWPIRFSELFEFQLRRALCKFNSSRYIYSLVRFWSRNEYRNFYSPQTFKIVALQMATRPLFVPVDMSTVVPSFNSTAPTTFFSFTTLTLFSFSHWTTIKPIFRIAILSKTVENELIWPTSYQPLKSTFKDERQMESSLLPTTGMIMWIFRELS